MTVRCIKQHCNESVLLLPLQADSLIEDDNFILLMGYTVESEITEYHVSMGADYTVYGILVYKNQIRYLIQDDDGIPLFCPQELFRIWKPDIFWDWEVASFLADSMPLFVIGYPSMEGRYDELIDLVSKKESAIKKFLKYKEHTEM